MSRSPLETSKEKGCTQSAKIRAASLNLAKAKCFNSSDYKTISGDVLPDDLLSMANGHIEQAMLRLVYQHPFINTHSIQEILCVSNAAQYSRKLNLKLWRHGYRIAKHPLKGRRRFWLWTLEREVAL
ncbi:hypothetical protein I6M44_15700 [Shewanella algae]|uniref:hypothetical protein n=1 Tax=Shewanella algae TaxID=38313 RepID=UPI001AAD839D|nr:hypothetical protein [Shewanella algae]MBO2625494.1 hypothetical protein [Shewanella algae]